MDRLILVEGLPGSGKTTFAKMLGRKLAEAGQEVRLYVEGDLHPADLAWCAYLTPEEYQAVCQKYPDCADALEQTREEWNGGTVLAYSRIGGLPEELAGYLEQKEIYDGRVGTERFCALQKSRWKKFGREAAGTAIFECAFLQNTVNELTLFACMEEDALFRHLKELADSVSRLDPLVLYLDMDAEAAVNRAAEERVDGRGNRVWEQRVSEYISASPYGRKHGLSGVSGMYRYFETRRQLELRLLERLPVEACRVPMDPENQNIREEELLRETVRRLETDGAF